MSAMASQITSLTIVYSTVYSGADQRKHQSSASLAFVRGIHRGPVNSPHKGRVTWKMFPFDDVIMYNTDLTLLISQQLFRPCWGNITRHLPYKSLDILYTISFFQAAFHILCAIPCLSLLSSVWIVIAVVAHFSLGHYSDDLMDVLFFVFYFYSLFPKFNCYMCIVLFMWGKITIWINTVFIPRRKKNMSKKSL